MIRIINEINTPVNIRYYLKKHLGFSTSLIAKVKFGGVKINGQTVHMRATVNPGDTLEICYPEEDSENIEPMDIPLNIIYEDDYIIAVDKPVNMPVHPSKGNNLPTLANAIRAYLDKPFVFRAVNRLDRDTCGLVLIAKNQLAGAKLCQHLKNGEFSKKYLGRVVGCPEEKEGTINAPIERECENSIKRIVREDGKEAVTKYKVLSSNNNSSLVELVPITGRTHQLRVHMAHIGHPLVADFLYGQRQECSTYYLKCTELSFPHPQTNEIITLRTEA